MCYPGFKELYKRFYTSHALKPYQQFKNCSIIISKLNKYPYNTGLIIWLIAENITLSLVP